MRLGRSVERPQECAALDPGALLTRVDTNRTHRSEIDHQPIIWDSQAQHAVSTATDAELEVQVARGPNRCPHVRDVVAASDQARPPVDHRVPYRARRVIARVSGGEDIAVDCPREVFLDHGPAPMT